MRDNNRGLCMTCDNEPTCMYQAIPRRTVFYCEEFWQEPPAPLPVRFDDLSAGRSAPSRNGVHGLCGTCENRQHCTLQKVEGGVWHCEEYS